MGRKRPRSLTISGSVNGGEGGIKIRGRGKKLPVKGKGKRAAVEVEEDDLYLSDGNLNSDPMEGGQDGGENRIENTCPEPRDPEDIDEKIPKVTRHYEEVTAAHRCTYGKKAASVWRKIPKHVIEGKGVDYSDFSGFGILEAFREQGWYSIFDVENEMAEGPIKDFYANMEYLDSKKKELATKVGKTRVVLTANQLSAYLGFQDVNNEFWWNRFSKKASGKAWVDMISFLTGKPAKEVSYDTKLYVRDLTSFSKVLHSFIIHCVLPRTGDVSKVQEREIPLMYFLARGQVKMNLSWIMMNHMWLSFDLSTRHTAPYGFLLTKLFRAMNLLSGKEKLTSVLYPKMKEKVNFRGFIFTGDEDGNPAIQELAKNGGKETYNGQYVESASGVNERGNLEELMRELESQVAHQGEKLDEVIRNQDALKKAMEDGFGKIFLMLDQLSLYHGPSSSLIVAPPHSPQ